MSNSDAKTVVITGATRGLGRAMVVGFIERGHTVIGCGRSEEGIESLREEFGEPHRFDQLDVTDDAQVAVWAGAICSQFQPPDLLLNNAAIVNKNAPLWEVSAKTFSDVIDVNIKGVTNVIRHFVPAMIDRGEGVIVNFSSGWGRSTSPEVAPYCATKWAIEGLTQALAQELPRGLAAVPLNPGIIDTDMLRICFGGSAAGYPNPSEWSKKAVPFLLSFDSSHNGEPLTVPI
jgi:NAD(P)-dependent dehydrogenase (short-subunit alcohol dehydrogenase family)